MEIKDDIVKVPKLSYENSKRLLGLGCRMQSAIDDLIRDGYDKSREKVTSDVNKEIFEMAEKRKCSIYDICFHFMPVESEFRTEIDKSDPRSQRYAARSVQPSAPTMLAILSATSSSDVSRNIPSVHCSTSKTNHP